MLRPTANGSAQFRPPLRPPSLSIRKERDALRARVDAARDQAAFATGTDYDEYLTRDAKDAARIREYEQQMASGEKRTQELERQLGGLGAIQEVFSRYFADKAAVGMLSREITDNPRLNRIPGIMPALSAEY